MAEVLCMVMSTIGILADFCVEPLPPVPPIEDLPIVVTYYYPDQGGVNCNQDCSILADNQPWDAGDYGNVAACPRELFYQHLEIQGFGTVHCRDTGPAVTVRWNDYWQQYVIHVDVLEEVGVDTYNYWLFDEWRYVK